MSDAEVRRQREAAIAKSEAARPEILKGLRGGEELLSIAKRVAEEHSVDETQAYKWVALIEQKFSSRKKVISTLGLLVLWIGALSVVSGLILLVIGFESQGLLGFSLPVTLLLGGGVLIVPGSVFSLLARKFVFRVKA